MKRILTCCLALVLLFSLCAIPTTAAGEWSETSVNSVAPVDEHIMMHDGTNEVVVAFRTVVTGKWYGIAPYVGKYDNPTEQFSVSVYAWDTDYATTIAGTALRTGIVKDAFDDGSAFVDLMFDEPLDAGDYLVVYHDATPGAWGIAVWFCPAPTTGVQVWKNGVKFDDKSVSTKIYVEGAAGNGFVKTPLGEKPVPALEDPYQSASGNCSYGYNGNLWNPKNSYSSLNCSEIAIRTVTVSTVNWLSIYSSCSNDVGGGFLFSAYAWAGDYKTTVATDAICQYVVSNISNGKFVNIPFEGGLAAGDYLFVISDMFHAVPGGSVSIWYSELNTTKASVTFVDGAETENDLFAVLYTNDPEVNKAIAPAAKLIPAADVTQVPPGANTNTFTGGSDGFMNLLSYSVGVRAVVTSNWYGIGFNSACGSNGGSGGFIASVYEWDTDYATTVAGKPVEQKRIEFSTPAAGGITPSYMTFDHYLPAGEYLIVASNGYDTDWGRGFFMSGSTLPGYDTETYLNGAPYAKNAMFALFITAPSGEGIAKLPEALTYQGFQTSETVDGKFNIRFVASGNDTEAQKVGFLVKATNMEGKEWDVTSNTVYSSILATSATGDMAKKILASSFDANYLAALTIKNVPAETEIHFEVTPYIVSVSGTIVYGTSCSVVINADGTYTQTAI